MEQVSGFREMAISRADEKISQGRRAVPGGGGGKFCQFLAV
ncbi:MAG: hypothetical protein ACI9R3_006147, partial [Verrucomicrobiales bacterium]